MTTPIWTITTLDCKPDVDGKTDYVVVAHWDCTATDGQYSGRVYNTTSFEVDPNKPNYIPYAGAETVAATEANVLQQIETQKNPPIVQPKLPWA